MNEENGLVSLPPNGRPLMVNVKAEDVITENERANVVELRAATRIAYKQLQMAMKTVCMVYDPLFQRLLKDRSSLASKSVRVCTI